MDMKLLMGASRPQGAHSIALAHLIVISREGAMPDGAGILRGICHQAAWRSRSMVYGGWQ
ncbi:hypothetical protein ACJ7C5_03795 [Nocardiopsis yanglingensis]